jgi:tripartite-type tricarboxylate transporter receptor subunit TctC
MKIHTQLTIFFSGILFAIAVYAQSYPVKPILMIVPLQAGSAGDVMMRIVAQKMSENLGQQIVIDNQAGAAGLIGAERIARAVPDGYTIGGISDSVLNFAPNLYQKVNFDPIKSFEPISAVAAIAWVMIVHPSLPARNVKEFIVLAKARPGQLDFSSGGNGSPQHIAMEVFAARTGVKLNHVPYRGATQAALDVVGGQIPCMFTATSIVLGNIREGKVRALGVGSARRSALLPEVPTIAEAGVPGFEYFTWAGIFVPKGTPKAIIDRLNAEAVKAVNDPATRERLRESALDPIGSSADELGRITRESHERMGNLIRKIGLQPQ